MADNFYGKYTGMGGGGGSGGVTSLDAITGAITLVAGSGITITDNSGAKTITIASTSTGDVTLSAFGSTPNANGASLTGQALTLQPASASFPGGVSTTTQSFAGAKTFTTTTTSTQFNTSSNGAFISGVFPAVASNNMALLSASNFSGNAGLELSTGGNTVFAAYADADAGIAFANVGRVAAFARFYNQQFQLIDVVAGGTYLQGSNTAIVIGPGTTLTMAGSSSGVITTQTQAASGTYNWNMPITVGSAGQVLTSQAGGSNAMTWTTLTAGTVTAVSVASSNGFAGSSSGGATPTLTLSTTVTGILQGNGTAISAASTTGSGNVVLATAPTMTNPIVGTQSQGDSSTKAASTSYVDVAIANAIAGVNPAVAVQAATTAAGDTSGFTYNNGASGIGAFFTGGVNTAVTIDGYTFTALGQRLLIKNDTQSPSGAFNGVYYVTQVQTGILPPVFTRALDYDTPSDMNNTGAIPVINGTVNGTTSWVLTSLIVTVGTTPVTFTKFTRNPADYLLVTNNLSDVASKSTSFDNLSPMTASGDLIYGGTSGTGTRLAANSTGTSKYLKSVSSGTPAWTQIAFSDLSGSVTAAQLPAFTGDVTTSAGSSVTTVAATQVNIATLSNPTGVAVHGSTNNIAQAAGYIGEVISSSQTTPTNFPTSTQYGDLTSISLTAGNWLISANMDYLLNGATVTSVRLGISTTSGNSSTGLTDGDTQTHLAAAIASDAQAGGALPYVQKLLSGTTTVYLKYRSAYSVATPQAVGRITAIRIS